MTSYKTIKVEKLADGSRVVLQRPKTWLENVWSQAFVWGQIAALGAFFVEMLASGYLTEADACVNGWCREMGPPLWTVRAGLAGGIAIIFIWVALAIAVRAKNPSRLP